MTHAPVRPTVSELLAGALEERDALRAAGDELAAWIRLLPADCLLEGDPFLHLRAWDDARTGAVSLGPARRQT
jgi:hypothetical protein